MAQVEITILSRVLIIAMCCAQSTDGQSTVNEEGTCAAQFETHAIISQLEYEIQQMTAQVAAVEKKQKENAVQIGLVLDNVESKVKGLEFKLSKACECFEKLSKPIVMVKRYDGSVDFNLMWNDYKLGFGEENGEFWLGLDKLHALTQSFEYGINVTMTTWKGRSFWAYYSSFSVGPESDNYRLSVSGYDVRSTAGDSLRYHSGAQFSTKDRDNDNIPDASCSGWYSGGWWYAGCMHAKATGRYFQDNISAASGILWYYLPIPNYNPQHSLKEMQISLIPKSV